jgi:DNA repair protein RecO (recombination protein O)
MINSTYAIILRTVPFGETSLVVSAFTKAYGLQSYLVKGARSTGKKGQSLRPYLQPGALLDLVVYHHEGTDHLQYIREMRWAKVYNRVLTSVVHNAVATFMVELLTRCIRQSEPNADLYSRVEAYFLLLDEAEAPVVANLPLHFTLFLAGELGFRPENNYSEHEPFFDLAAGHFTNHYTNPANSIEGENAQLLNELLSIDPPVTLYRVKMNRLQRRELMISLAEFFRIHAAGFGQLRSLDVLEVVFDA